MPQSWSKCFVKYMSVVISTIKDNGFFWRLYSYFGRFGCFMRKLCEKEKHPFVAERLTNFYSNRKRRGRDDIVKSCLERKSIFCSSHWLSVFPIMSVALWPPTKRRRKGAAKANKRKKKSKEKVIFFSLKSRVFSTAWFCVLLIQDEREL